MSERYLHDFDEEPRLDQPTDHEKGTERLASITQYPLNQSELPPLPPWYWRWLVTLWKLVPCTILGMTLVGIVCMLCEWGGDMLTGLLKGLILGALCGVFFDSRFAMAGGTIDD